MLRALDQLTLPAPWVRGLLVAIFLGFGVLVGNVTSGSATSANAPQAHLKLMLPPATVAAAVPTAPSTPPAPAATPTPTKPLTAGGSESASTTTASGAGGGSSGNRSSRGSGSGSGSGQSGGEGSEGSGSGAGGSSKLPAIKHVFVIVLADQPYAAVFGPASKATYLAHTLEQQGELLVRSSAGAHDELANGIALVSGQGPTAQTALNCPTFAEISPAGTASDGQVTGQGCVYPKATPTLAVQLTAKHLTWRAYVEGMTSACARPALGAADATVVAAPGASPPPPTSTTPAAGNQVTPANAAAMGAQYTTFRNPFVYFHSAIEPA